jgi:hypothetical protein
LHHGLDSVFVVEMKGESERVMQRPAAPELEQGIRVP